ncbi:hypothetical protein P7K49_013218 [Saguinus oedipus]|uniref:Uncharacterized protein n=1 Tax=Saguinus oedipus TaxID=9490 RepID=A0ABQ9VHE3_SAGOE|nr:hypothetical protein P7K49_013218 [Saguinus oedipus]
MRLSWLQCGGSAGPGPSAPLRRHSPARCLHISSFLSFPSPLLEGGAHPSWGCALQPLPRPSCSFCKRGVWGPGGASLETAVRDFPGRYATILPLYPNLRECSLIKTTWDGERGGRLHNLAPCCQAQEKDTEEWVMGAGEVAQGAICKVQSVVTTDQRLGVLRGSIAGAGRDSGDQETDLRADLAGVEA